MTYTAEQLRRVAVAIERMHGETLTVEWRDHQAGLLRAFADALEENARLKAAWDASHEQAMKNGAACNEWRDRAERAEAELAAERERADRNQEDAERLDWMDKSAFTAYRDRDPEYGELYDFATVVNEDRKGDRVGEVFKTIREAIDSARRK